MTITFPILLKYKKQYQMCMDFLESHGSISISKMYLCINYRSKKRGAE